VAGPSITTEALVLLKRPPSDTFQTLSVFSAEHGTLLVMQRRSLKSAGTTPALDLFDELAVVLEGAAQGNAWFVKEARVLARHAELGRSYATLQAASDLALLVARNAVPEESRGPVYALLRDAFAAFGASDRPDIVYLKSLYRFARDEGYPVKQQWFPTLPAADRAAAATVLNQPLAVQTAAPSSVAKLRRRLEDYLRGETEILLD
jgi:recombinational DNA repair protein (RecF pathway)